MNDLNSTGDRLPNSERKISPFLAKAGTPRTGENHLPGYYCKQKKMWVIDTENGAQPIINEQALSQLMTKTNQKTESDDENWPIRYSNLLQLVTKTDSTQEADDNYSASQIQALVTKTKTQQEADDDCYESFGFLVDH